MKWELRGGVLGFTRLFNPRQNAHHDVDRAKFTHVLVNRLWDGVAQTVLIGPPTRPTLDLTWIRDRGAAGVDSSSPAQPRRVRHPAANTRSWRSRHERGCQATPTNPLKPVVANHLDQVDSPDWA